MDARARKVHRTQATAPGAPLLRAAAFPIRFFVLFAVLACASEAVRGGPGETAWVQHLFLQPTAALINALEPGEHAVVAGRAIASQTSMLRVTRGCEGTELLLLLFGAILAYPAGLLIKTRGLIAGVALAYGLGIARLLALHYPLSSAPHAWDALHGLVLPALPLALIALYFMSWSAAAAATTGAHGGAR